VFLEHAASVSSLTHRLSTKHRLPLNTGWRSAARSTNMGSCANTKMRRPQSPGMNTLPSFWTTSCGTHMLWRFSKRVPLP
jgi:hypothetical protein